jgi:hypothetical protein
MAYQMPTNSPRGMPHRLACWMLGMFQRSGIAEDSGLDKQTRQRDDNGVTTLNNHSARNERLTTTEQLIVHYKPLLQPVVVNQKSRFNRCLRSFLRATSLWADFGPNSASVNNRVALD